MLTKMIKVNWILDRTKKKQKWRRDTRRECKQQNNTKGKVGVHETKAKH